MMKAFCTYLTTDSSGGLGLIVGQTLYAGSRPQDAPDLCTTVLEPTGEQPNKYLRTHRTVYFQLVTRGGSYFEARDESKRIWEWLISPSRINITLTSESGDVWTNCHIEGISNGYIGQDDRSRHEFTANIAIRAKKGS